MDISGQLEKCSQQGFECQCFIKFHIYQSKTVSKKTALFHAVIYTIVINMLTVFIYINHQTNKVLMPNSLIVNMTIFISNMI